MPAASESSVFPNRDQGGAKSIHVILCGFGTFGPACCGTALPPGCRLQARDDESHAESVHLSFYPDAKIGVLGVNGSGKSTLLRIMAGLDKEYSGEAWVAEGARVGYLEQEPQLDAAKTVRENVMLGVAKQKAILDRYNELAMNYSDETADEMTKLQDEIEAAGLWDLDSKVDQAMDALRCPPDDADVTKLSGGERRRVALCKLLLDQPDLLLLDEPTNHLDAEFGVVAGRPFAQLSRRDPDRHP